LEAELDALRILRSDRAVANAAMSAFGELAERSDGYHRVPVTDALIAADRVLAHAACNLAREAPSLSCRVESRTVEDDAGTIETSRLVIGEACDLDADALLATRSDDDRTDCEIATEWLADELADGEWRKGAEIKIQAQARGIAERTLQRARKLAGVEDRRRGFPAVSEWRLPVVPTIEDKAGATVGGTTEQTRTAEPNPANAEPQLCQVFGSGTTGTTGSVEPAQAVSAVTTVSEEEVSNGAQDQSAFDTAKPEPDPRRYLRGRR
jgi:hypothetical protein